MMMRRRTTRRDTGDPPGHAARLSHIRPPPPRPAARPPRPSPTVVINHVPNKHRDQPSVRKVSEVTR